MLLNNPVWPESNYLCLVQRNDFIRYHCVARCLLFLAHFCTDNAALAEAPSYWPLLFYTSSKAPTFWQPTSLSLALLKWSCLQDGWRDLENKTPGRVSLFFFLNSVMQSSHSRPLSEALSRGRVYNQVCFSHFVNSNMIRGGTVKGRIKPEEIATQSACKKETVAKFSAKEPLFLQHEGNRNSLMRTHTHTHTKSSHEDVSLCCLTLPGRKREHVQLVRLNSHHALTTCLWASHLLGPSSARPPHGGFLLQQVPVWRNRETSSLKQSPGWAANPPGGAWSALKAQRFQQTWGSDVQRLSANPHGSGCFYFSFPNYKHSYFWSWNVPNFFFF